MPSPDDFYSHDISAKRRVGGALLGSEGDSDLEYRFGSALVATRNPGQVFATLVAFTKARFDLPEGDDLPEKVEEVLDALTMVVAPALLHSMRYGREQGERQKAQDVATKLGLGILK